MPLPDMMVSLMLFSPIFLSSLFSFSNRPFFGSFFQIETSSPDRCRMIRSWLLACSDYSQELYTVFWDRRSLNPKSCKIRFHVSLEYTWESPYFLLNLKLWKQEEEVNSSEIPQVGSGEGGEYAALHLKCFIICQGPTRTTILCQVMSQRMLRLKTYNSILFFWII